MNNYQMPPLPPAPSIGFIDAIKLGFRNYSNFSGRATRAEYWWWVLFTFLASNVLGVMGQISSFFYFIAYLIGIALFIPSLAISWRRMHDIGKGGGWVFINLVLFVGWIIWIVFCCKPSEPFANRFGDVPSGAY